VELELDIDIDLELELDGQAVGQLGPRLDRVRDRFSPHHVGACVDEGRGGEGR
jgi:hypothetical protein